MECIGRGNMACNPYLFRIKSIVFREWAKASVMQALSQAVVLPSMHYSVRPRRVHARWQLRHPHEPEPVFECSFCTEVKIFKTDNDLDRHKRTFTWYPE